MNRLDGVLHEVRHQPAGFRHRQMLQFLQDFALLRRDLRQAYRAYQAMNSIRVLTRIADLELSRGNSTLNEFVLADEQKPEQRRIRSHVVLKADVRGSTEMIRELRRRRLNPASHFSRNFFEPINRLLALYGAKKTFVEGDAVILSLFEYEDKHYRWLCVSLACGLASKILRVVDERNLECRENGLPELELGLGIAFLDEAPTFLSDEDREIMISPAINRADQLSSCSALLRKSEFGRQLGRGVEVVAASGLPILEKESNDHMMRYNVNGIELDTPAFVKLQSELALQVVRLEEEIYPGGSRFYVGKFSDLQGGNHWLVVREAPVRVWSGGKAGEGEQFGHRFYQVVAEPEVIKKVTQSPTLTGAKSVRPKEEGATPPPTEMHFEL
jgi:class 3 adenylate cyclase